ncbi:MAG: DEAD/DEAH box helicase, partial [Acidobacteria bacterium]|nr:DEAD/DEAH box helicase [Acidobacteriota bacterium]
MTDRVVQKKEILRKIENLSKQISHLKSEKLKLEKELRELLVNPVEDNLEVIENTQDKIALYRSLFRGREDVYPRLWQSKTTGKSGYSPACQNEWKSQLCRKFKIKCGDCPNRRFIPLTDQIIQYHLEGRHAIGIYPLLKNDCCFFLALDFDGKGWFEDASAFRTTCRSI